MTQRAMYPESTVEVTLDPSDLKDGDFAGLCVLQGCYGWIGVTREYGRYYIVMWNRKLQDCMFHELAPDYMPGTEGFRVPYGGDDIRLKIHVDLQICGIWQKFFTGVETDGNEWAAIGSILNLTILWDAGTDCLPILQPKQAEAQNSMTLHIVWKIYDRC